MSCSGAVRSKGMRKLRIRGVRPPGAAVAGAAVFPMLRPLGRRRPASADDKRFMRIAMDEARRAEFPFGAVIVRDGAVIARGRNLGRGDGDPTAHGEMVAIRRCLADHGPGAARQHPLHRGPLRDVHGRHPVVPARPAGIRRFGRAARDQDRSDHDFERRGRRQGAFRADSDHRRRAGGRGHAAVRSK